MDNKIEALKEAHQAGRIVGITTTAGEKHNGQIQCFGDATVMLYDRNKRQNIVLQHEEIESARCGK